MFRIGDKVRTGTWPGYPDHNDRVGKIVYTGRECNIAYTDGKFPDYGYGWLPEQLTLIDDDSISAEQIVAAVVNFPKGCKDEKEAFLKSLGLEWPKNMTTVKFEIEVEYGPRDYDGEGICDSDMYNISKYVEQDLNPLDFRGSLNSERTIEIKSVKATKQ